mmetsp:Transcript_19243/g.60526  ORF Transcript_19243/g.60526 Transcript_19243/m.60526 type:complete len:181 (-) Transcript_19243:148-690(-)|eukprot:CAMPEP_0197388318 /NCGR_PEP_ID=MMETSP1165-20131217/1007_1 /TAXON_ID=284809 /ORGANISM="Chrysocystis fragilis, Strain CCMP3189" /LENGTH=180 /DNA_ID=CAMNT_0042913661 /DNA_START=101 /DNA_END=643 /DNA_ORIENTATION=+
MAEDQPYWLRDESQRMTSTNPMHGGGVGSGSSAAGGEETTGKPAVVWGFRIVHFGLCAMMAATGALSIMGFGSINGNQLSGFFVALYLLMFAALWFTFEVMQIQPIDWIVFHLHRNFGFLFHPMGKALFIIFVAFLNFGVKEGDQIGLATGLLCIIDGVALIFLYLKYPQWHPTPGRVSS